MMPERRAVNTVDVGTTSENAAPGDPAAARHRHGSTRLKYLAFWAITLGTAALLMFGAMEIALRILLARTFVAETDAPLVRSDVAGLGYELAPNRLGAVQTDASGIRVRGGPWKDTDLNILLLGDSVAFGSGVKYASTFGPRIEGQLSAALNRPVAVWNAAVPGYNTQQEAIAARRLGPRIKPALILVELCMNDYLEAPRLTAGGMLDATAPESNRGITSLLYRSRTIVFVKEKIKDVQKARPEWFPMRLHYISRLSGKPGWAKVREGLSDLKATADQVNSHLLVVLFPVEEQLRLNNRAVQSDLSSFMASANIDSLDLFPAFQAHWREGLYVDYWDQAKQVDKLHLNERGHALVAKTLQDAIERWAANRAASSR